MTPDYSNYIVCPKCRGDLTSKDGGLYCPSCGSSYEIREGIPVLADLDKIPVHLKNQIKYFEQVPVNPVYAAEEWQVSYIERFLENFPDAAGRVCLDCGTGSGYMSIELAKRGAFVIACDLTLKSLYALKKNCERLGLEILIICCSAEELPLKDGCADYFVSNAVLEHLPREREAVSEISRVCRAESGLFVTVPVLYRFLWFFLIPVNFIHDKIIGHLRRYSRGILLSKFGPYGFAVRNVYYTGHLIKTLGVLLSLLLRLKSRKLERFLEEADKKPVKKPFGSSNIILALERHNKI